MSKSLGVVILVLASCSLSSCGSPKLWEDANRQHRHRGEVIKDCDIFGCSTYCYQQNTEDAIKTFKHLYPNGLMYQVRKEFVADFNGEATCIQIGYRDVD